MSIRAGEIAGSPTWREALAQAFDDVDRALEHRRQVVQAAHDAGLSLRQIASAVGVDHNRIHRMLGKRGRPNDTRLDRPADVTRP